MKQGIYVPTRPLAFTASLGRLYRDTAEAIRSNSHSVALRAAYDALDCLEGIRWNAFDKATNSSKVRKVLERLRETAFISRQGDASPVRACSRSLGGGSGRLHHQKSPLLNLWTGQNI